MPERNGARARWAGDAGVRRHPTIEAAIVIGRPCGSHGLAQRRDGQDLFRWRGGFAAVCRCVYETCRM